MLNSIPPHPQGVGFPLGKTMKNKIFVIGNTSEISINLFKNFYIDDEIIGINSNNLNFLEPNSGQNLQNMLRSYNPDLIFVFSGVIGSDESMYHEVFDINFKPFHEIVKFYKKNPTNKKLKIIVLGSKSFKGGRKDYLLYSASKAALHNLFLSACSIFKNKNITLGIIHLPKVKTKMIKNLNGSYDALDIQEASKIIFDFEKSIQKSSSLIYDDI